MLRAARFGRNDSMDLSILVLWLGILTLANIIDAEKYLQGQNATLTCDAEPVDSRSASTRQPTVIMWSKVGKDGGKTIVASFAAGGTSKISSNGPLAGRAIFDPPFLRIHDLKVDDSGTYECQVIEVTAASDSSFFISLEVNAIPEVSVEVKTSPKVDASGRYVAAECQASRGKPAATIRWIRTQNGEHQESELSEEALADGSFNVKSKLLLKPGLLGRQPNSTDPVTEKDWRKNFSCVVEHDYLDDQEQPVTVPIDLLYPPVVTVSVKSNKLTCNAFGNPIPSIIWIRPNGSTEVGSKSIFVDQFNPEASSGRYVCLARSSIGPNAVSAIDVQKSSDLPVLLVSTLRYNASLPVKAKNYEMECTAELENMESSAIKLAAFVWSKDGKTIEENLSRYSIRETKVKISSEIVLVKSVLRIIEVDRRRDESLFKCRLILSTPGNGYVRAVERIINVKVDYPPDKVKASVLPSLTVREHTEVRLSCYAESSPPSSYLWYFNGNVLSSRRQLVLRDVSRTQAGMYKCVAFNYVPGSAATEVRLVVNYPPGRVLISKIGSSLSCSTEGGSLPAPFYTWLLPNETVINSNKSIIEIGPVHSTSEYYTCVVGNGLGKTSNATFRLDALREAGIGSLTIVEFVVTVIISLLVLVILVVSAVWIVRRSHWGRKAAVTKSKKDSYDTSAPAPCVESVAMPTKPEGKPALVNYVTLTSKSNLASLKEADKDQPSRYRSVEVLDGSGVEILENSSMTSVKDRESTLPRAKANSPLKMTTFTQQQGGLGYRTHALKNYNTTRNPVREKVKTSALTRALSENLRPVPFGGPRKPTSGTGTDAARDHSTAEDSVVHSNYSSSDHARVTSPRPAMSTPIPPGQSPCLQKCDKETGYCSDSSETSSSTGKPSFDYQHVTSASRIGGCANQAFPAFPHNVANDLCNFHSEMDFRPSPLPPRCQSVDPYNIDCTPPMPEIPSRNYLYNPYADSRLFLPPVCVKSSLQGTPPTTIGSPYDSGGESKSSNVTTATSSGKRMQSLTLV